MRILTLALLAILAACSTGQDWRTASREPAGLAPDPARTPGAVIQVYGADAWGWRGWFAIHTWIAVKRSGEPSYTVYEVVGWRASRGLPVVRVAQDAPDRYWFGAKPRLLAEQRGEHVDALITAVDQAAGSYPWSREYSAFPGPNSNTFVAWVGRQVPELELCLPFSAIGSGYAKRNPGS